MSSEKHVFCANFRTVWDDVTALYTKIGLIEDNFELTCGHFAMALRHSNQDIQVSSLTNLAGGLMV